MKLSIGTKRAKSLSRFALTLVFLALLFIPAVSFAQTTNASVGGTVTDPSGAVLPGATVTATNTATGIVTKMSSNEAGAYQFPSLQTGNYKISAEFAGFKTYTYNNVVLEVAAQMRINFTLAVATAETTIEVNATMDTVANSGTTVGTVITGQRVTDLPLTDRNAVSLVTTQAGVVDGNIAGGRISALNVTLNGINITNTRLDRNGGLNSGQLSQSVDLVEEVRVTTSPADAEMGRGVGQVQMIMRSGSNAFHGSVVYSLRNTALNANSFFNNLQNLPRQDLKRNQFAGRLGGPIIKNKTFFFFLYDGQRQNSSKSVTNTVLTDTARQGIFRFFPGVQNGNAIASTPTVDLSGSPVQPASATGPLQSVSIFGRDPNRLAADSSGLMQSLLNQVPLPNDFRAGDGLNTAGYTWLQPRFADRDQLNFKVDHQVNNSNRLSVVVTREEYDQTNMAAAYPGGPNDSIIYTRSWFGSISLTSTVRSSMVNEFRMGMQHPFIDQVGSLRDQVGKSRSPAGYAQYPKSNGWAYSVSGLSFSTPLVGNNDAQLVNPVYTIGDSFSWIKGNHTFKWGLDVNYANSNSYNIIYGTNPTVTLGAGNVAVTGISTIPSIGANVSVAQTLLTTLAGSVSSISQGYSVPDGANPAWAPKYPNARDWHQRDFNWFFKDDFKVSPNLTLNLGVRYEWYGAPWEKSGRVVKPENGVAGLFGITGSSMADLWQPGLLKGSLTKEVTVGKFSQNPSKQLYGNDNNNFAPAVGLSWSIPYFGKNKTTLRMGYGWTYTRPMSFLGIDGMASGIRTSVTYNPTTITKLTDVQLPLAPIDTPLSIKPLTDRTQTITAVDSAFRTPYVQNWNISLERALSPTWALSLRYIGNKGTRLSGGVNLNDANIFENKILDAFNTTVAGGNAALFDQIFNGLNLGLGVIDGTTVTASASLRNSSTTRGYFVSNSPGSFANWLDTTNAYTGANGGLLRRAGLPENFVRVNPQYATATFNCSCGNSTYNSGIVELNKRFASGWTFLTSYAFSKTLTSVEGTSVRNPRNWSIDKQQASFNRRHIAKASGTYALPFGPGAKFLNGKSNWLSRVLGGWQLGGIFSYASGQPFSITSSAAYSFTYGGATNTAALVGALPSDIGKLTKISNGVTYFPTLTQVTDPQVANITSLQNLKGFSTMKALALNGQVILQNPTPGTLGNLGINTFTGPGFFQLDMNLVKRIKVKEGITMELRVDVSNLTNTPIFGNPTSDINSTSFGRITQAVEGLPGVPLPVEGNRVIVLNARITF